MFNKFIRWLVNELFLKLDKRRDFFVHCIIFTIIVFPVALISGYSLWMEYEDMTDYTISKKQSVVNLSSLVVKERLNHMTDVAKSIANRYVVRSGVKENKIRELSNALDETLKEFSFIDRIFITDLKGTSLVIVPASPENIGKSFAFRDWYQGVIKNWKPYVSEIYRRTAIPQYNVITVAIPIKDDADNIIGILGMQIKLDVFAQWAKEISADFDDLIYFVDKNGKIIGHPEYLPQGDIIDFSDKFGVQKVLQGKDEIEIYFDNQTQENMLVGYKNISEYGIGIIAEMPTNKIFALRNKHLARTGVLFGTVIVVDIFLAYLIFKIMHDLNYHRRKEKIYLESIGDGVVAIDRNWNITLWNKAMESISGYSEEGAIGKPFREIIKLIRKNDRKEDIVFIEESMLYGKLMQMKENMILITKDKKEVPVGDTAAPIFSNGSVSGVIIIIRNVAREQEAQMIKSEFSYASHQLRTPVNKALWNLELVINEKSIKKIRESAIVAYKSLQSMQKLSEELIDISTIDQNIIIPQKSLVQIIDIFEDLKKSLKLKLEEKEIELIIPLISVSASIETDKKLLSRALYEVIENAILYSPVKSKIDIKININIENIIITISDNGIGILKEQQALIFTKFFRGYNINTTNIIGGGLGLYIAHKYINLLNGKIWFESEEGKGTTFYFTLPLS